MRCMSKEKEFLDKAKSKGYTPSVEVNWVVWRPAMPIDMLQECLNLNQDKLAELIKALKD